MGINKSTFILLKIILILSHYQVFSQFDYRYGKYKVGFECKTIPDSSRIFANGNIRQIQLGLWYPAAEGGEAFPMTNYINAYDSNFVPSNFLKINNSSTLAGLCKYFQADSVKVFSVLSKIAKAKYQAKKASGKFPLLLYAASLNGSFTENFGLAEYLASNGYIVACIPGWGEDSLAMKLDQRSLKAQENDLEHIYNFIQSDTHINQQSIIASGFSIGCIPALRLALKHPEIQAVVTLDGTHTYRYDMFLDSGQYAIQTLQMPYLQLSQRPFNRLKLDTTFYANQANSAIYVRYKNLDHTDFSSFYLFLNTTVNSADYKTRQLRNYPEFIEASIKQKEHLRMSTHVLDFVHALNNSSSSMELLKHKWDHELNLEIKSK